jgi:predicted SAM-dependent methyltransferase
MITTITKQGKKMKAMLLRAFSKALDTRGLELRRKPDAYQLATYTKLYDQKTLARRPFYNVGAGSFFHPHWTNIDFVSDWYKGEQKHVIHHDLMALGPLPIDDGTAEVIYTSHTIEHVKEPAVQNLFNEAFRALKPGGVLRVTTGPDAETDFRAMMRGDDDWFYWDESYVTPDYYSRMFKAPATSVPLEERWLHHVASQLAPNDITESKKYTAEDVREKVAELGFEGALDFFTSQCQFIPERPGNHVSWWTHGKVEKFMRNAGFENVYRSGHSQSVLPILRNTSLFDSTHPAMSIYVEAIKQP